MTDTQDTANSRIDTDRPTPEPSPSAGWRETAALMHAPAGLKECDAPDCDRVGHPVTIMGADRAPSVRCRVHSRDYFEVSS